MILLAALGAIVLSTYIAGMATPLSMRVAQRTGMLDRPARHKAHSRPMPVLGGSAILSAILGPALLVLSLASLWAALGPPEWLTLPDAIRRHVPGAASRAPVALGILTGAFVLHVVGLIDDRRHLHPVVKIIVQAAVAAGVTIGCGIRILTVAGPALSILATIAWLVAITNAFNFLDNMDGLAASVAAICAVALLGAAMSTGQIFVAGLLCLILGALLGFLPYNFPPARTYMGDAGSLVIGFLLGVSSCLTTYTRPGETYYLYGIFVPLVVMAIPLYDTLSVMIIRVRERRNPMVGDRSHFSHRLVRRGMTVRRTLLTICLATAGTAIAASLLPRVGNVGAVLVFCQTVVILLMIALLEAGDGRP